MIDDDHWLLLIEENVVPILLVVDISVNWIHFKDARKRADGSDEAARVDKGIFDVWVLGFQKGRHGVVWVALDVLLGDNLSWLGNSLVHGLHMTQRSVDDHVVCVD